MKKRRSLVPGLLSRSKRSYLNRVSGPLTLLHKRPFKYRPDLNMQEGVFVPKNVFKGKRMNVGHWASRILRTRTGNGGVRFRSIPLISDSTQRGMASQLRRGRTSRGISALKSIISSRRTSGAFARGHRFFGNQYVKLDMRFGHVAATTRMHMHVALGRAAGRLFRRGR